MKFSIGDLVVEKTDIKPSTSHCIMSVVTILDGNYLVEMWGDQFFDDRISFESEYTSEPGTRGWRENFLRYQESELFSADEALEERKRLEGVRDSLEEDFSKVRNRIVADLDMATAMVNNAADLLVKHKKTFESVLEECAALHKALKHGGWSHSTMRCRFG